MGWCFAPGCNHNEQFSCRKFKFPSDKQNQQKWTKLLECRSDRVPNKYTIVCSCHFVDQNKENGPTLFAHNAKKRLSFTSPEKKNRRSKSLDSRFKDGNCPEECTNVSSDNNNNKSDPIEIEALKEEVAMLKHQLEIERSKNIFSWIEISNDDRLVHFYTGLPSKLIFLGLFDYLKDLKIKYYYNWSVKRLSLEDQLFLTLVKLRLNLPHEHLANIFRCSVTTVSNIFLTWLYVLHIAIYKRLMSFPSRNKIRTCLPSAFSSFTNCRTIIDCTEVRISIPYQMDYQRDSYSSYKHSNTFKGLIGAAPNGVITFTSDLYMGSASDRSIVKTCGVLTHFLAGDLILADKGFLISDILPPGVALNIPPFLGAPQFTETEVKRTLSIAKARIHIERAICRVKNFKILRYISASLKGHASVVFQVCAALVNFQNPLLKEIEESLAYINA